MYMIKPLVTALVGSTVASLSGFTPVLGPGRALGLYLRSRLRRAPFPLSIRSAEIALLRQSISVELRKYHVISGVRGVGKTCLIHTALHGLPGVAYSHADPGDSVDTICLNALSAITKKTTISFWNPNACASRVLFWYRLLYSKSPIIVISLSDRGTNERFASIAGAVRRLTDQYHLNVIVDSSPNSIDSRLLQTWKDCDIHLERFTKEEIMSIPKYADLIRILDPINMTEVTWRVLGGNPALFIDLKDIIDGQTSAKDLSERVGRFLRRKIFDAIETIRTAQQENKHMNKLCTLVRERNNCLKERDRQKLQLLRHESDEVFTVVFRNRVAFLVPASNALEVVIQYGLVESPSIEDLKQILTKNST